MATQFDPLTGELLPESSAQAAAAPPASRHFIDVELLSRLDTLSREELISLIKCLPARITGYALQTKEERREAVKLRLYDIAMSAVNDAVTVKAANDWLDREEGKAIQRIDQRVQHSHAGNPEDMTSAQILEALRSYGAGAVDNSVDNLHIVGDSDTKLIPYVGDGDK